MYHLRCGNCVHTLTGALKGWSDTEEESSSSEGAEEDSEIESDSTEHSYDKSSKGKKKGTASDKVTTSLHKLLSCKVCCFMLHPVRNSKVFRICRSYFRLSARASSVALHSPPASFQHTS
jgi:hypothetical protein